MEALNQAKNTTFKSSSKYKKATQGNLDAMVYVAKAYDRGQLVPRNLYTAYKWYYKSAQQGYLGSIFRTKDLADNGYGYLDINTYNQWATLAEQRLSDSDLANQMINLGDLYGTDKDNINKYIYWYTLAGDKGNIKAMKELGDLYYEGKLANENLNKAYYWYKKMLLNTFSKHNNRREEYSRLGEIHNILGKSPKYTYDGYMALGDQYWFDMKTAKYWNFVDNGWYRECYKADTLLFGQQKMCKIRSDNGRCPAYSTDSNGYCFPT